MTIVAPRTPLEFLLFDLVGTLITIMLILILMVVLVKFIALGACL